jgi:hypothetical protein
MLVTGVQRIPAGRPCGLLSWWTGIAYRPDCYCLAHMYSGPAWRVNIYPDVSLALAAASEATLSQYGIQSSSSFTEHWTAGLSAERIWSVSPSFLAVQAVLVPRNIKAQGVVPTWPGHRNGSSTRSRRTRNEPAAKRYSLWGLFMTRLSSKQLSQTQVAVRGLVLERLAPGPDVFDWSWFK